jgi:ribonuclease P protein component
MLHKLYRLPAAVRLISPISFSTQTFFLKLGKNGLAFNRFAFVVRKSVDKRATARNRIRRLFRSCIEEMLPEITPGHDMLFLLKTQVLEMKREDLYNELHAFLKENKLLQ